MYRVIVIGGGSIGERHVRCFLKTGRAEVSVCDNRPECLAALRKNYPVAGAFPDFDGIDLSKFDAAAVCVPPNLHVPMARAIMEAGLHVLIEKPLSQRLEGVDGLEQIAKEKNLTVGVGFVRRGMSVYRGAYKELAAGTIGEVLSVACVNGYDHSRARPDYRNTYFAKRDTGGGVVPDLLSHFVNLLQWFMGPVKAVTCTSELLGLDGVDIEDTASMFLRFRNSKAMANLHALMWQAHSEETVTLSGTEGSIVCDRFRQRMGVLTRATGEWRWTENLGGEVDSKNQMDEPFVFEADNFLDAIEGKAEILSSLAESRHTLEVCLAALESAREQRTIGIGQ